MSLAAHLVSTGGEREYIEKTRLEDKLVRDENTLESELKTYLEKVSLSLLLTVSHHSLLSSTE